MFLENKGIAHGINMKQTMSEIITEAHCAFA